MANANQTEQVLEAKTPARTISAQYLLFLPHGYDPDAARRWPLLLFLHGSGERGKNLAKVSAHGPPRLVKNQPDFPFIVVSPQCPTGEVWSSQVLLLLLEEVMRRHLVDPARVYLTGLSMGGYGTWNLVTAAPQLFAAAVPICGGGDVLPLVLADRAALRALRSLPIWAFHGAKDPVVPVAESERMIGALRRIGNRANLTIYPEAGHDSWSETYSNPGLYAWLLKQRRRARFKLLG